MYKRLKDPCGVIHIKHFRWDLYTMCEAYYDDMVHVRILYDEGILMETTAQVTCCTCIAYQHCHES